MINILSSVFQQPFISRQRKALSSRADASLERFLQECAEDDFEIMVAQMVWNHLLDSSVVSGFRPLSDDSLQYIYGISEEELDEDIILNILNITGINPDKEKALRFGKVDSPKDVVKLISFLK